MKHVTKQFVLAGDAVFTIETPEGSHYTYKVEHVPARGSWKEAYFVKLLTGPDNTNDYSYLGMLDPFTSHVRTTTKSCQKQDAFPTVLLNRTLARVWSDDHDAYERHGFRTHHEGRCGRCGRALTVPESVESGFGPECVKMVCGQAA